MIIDYNADIVEINDLKMTINNKDFYYSITNGRIKIVYSSLNPTDIKKDDVLFLLNGTIINHDKENIDFVSSIIGEFGDYHNNKLYDIELSVTSLKSVPQQE